MSTASWDKSAQKGGLAADAPAKLIDIDHGRSAAVAEALFQRRTRFKPAIYSM